MLDYFWYVQRRDFGYRVLKVNASRPSEHPSVREKDVKTFRWDHRLQIENIFMAFKRVPRWGINSNIGSTV